MTRGTLREVQSGGLALHGVIDMHVGAELRDAGRRLLAASAGRDVWVDCAAITQSSSVGLSLLLCWLRDARATGKQLQIRNLPDDMRQVAEVYGLLELLPLAD
ncbi:STAS domain-containing protein [Pseudomonas oryzae]|uniref:Phospholipid transport system transporter-binding protein n=1 Tax=Pseudomonas oryzae TaxID=1392877 RepID=A0A1H1LCH5_9PSED|nr:STAS domain-containing protein [Pseudomonas oryzae]SDR72248.1 phospholipid transport system transporter-binding protein [Pseudomonas oryzae]